MLYKLVADTKQVQFAVQPRAIPGKLTKKKNIQTEDKATLSTAAEIWIDPGPNACKKKRFWSQASFLAGYGIEY